jgi:probable rRNA maturation factor
MISFFVEDIEFSLPNESKVSSWLSKVIENEDYKLFELNYIFCTDEYLLGINLQYLNHDTFTDIITFDNSEEDDLIEGDIFISIERVRENAHLFNVEFINELLRVLVHGVLHLCGYHDKSTKESLVMRQKEDYYIQLF